MYWKRHKPVIIQALVDLAALIRPLLNTSFNLGLRTKLLAPPVTEITRLGISRFHLSSINFRMSWTSVSCDTRTYYGYKKGDLGLLSRISIKDMGESLSLSYTCHTRLPSTTLPFLPDKHFIKGQALGKLTGCEDGFFFSPGLTIYRKVYPTKKFSSKSFACLWKPVALQLKTSMKPIPSPPPPSPPSLTPVPLTRHYNKYSINPAWSAATYWRAFILTACTKEVNLPICISLHLPCAPFWGPLIACVLSGHI